MNVFGKSCLLPLASLFAVSALAVEVPRSAGLPPSAPLFLTDPMLSVWSPHAQLATERTRHWSCEQQRVTAVLDVDGVRYRLIGSADDEACAAAVQKTASVGATRTRFVLAAGPVEADLVFFSPLVADDLDVLSRPVSYLKADFRATDGRAHDLSLTVRVTGELASQHHIEEGESNPVALTGARGARVGRWIQTPFGQVGDLVRPDWGWAYVVSPDDVSVDVPNPTCLRVCDMTVSLGWRYASATSATARCVLAYDDLEGLMFLRRACPGWWARDGKRFETMLAEAVADFDRLDAKTAAFDVRLHADAESVGGADYAKLADLAWRQSYGACKLVAGPDGEMLYFSKENGSGGFIGTVDVFYPQLPHLLLTSLPLVKATLRPTLVYASTPEWKHDFAPHDLGLYPVGNHQTYNWKGIDAPGTPGMMPVEECGNMLVSLCALATAEGHADFAAPWWPEVRKWAAYLERVGVDPGEQLCTDDFAGHLAHNANLSLKSIVALAAYARMARMRGEADEARRVESLAKTWAADWQCRAAGGREGAYRLAFDLPGTWSLKYNLVWDRLLGLGLFPPEVAAREMRAYLAMLDDAKSPFGLALDSRDDPNNKGRFYTKSDWTVWAACLTGDRSAFERLIAPVCRMAERSPTPYPLSDWYYTDDGTPAGCGFRGRSVVGGFYLPFLFRDDLVKAYRGRQSR